MFAYPKQAEFNHPVPKGKIYAHAKPGRKVKEIFVSQVREIVWKYKLSPETINLPARHGIAEIQVFEIALKILDYDPVILRTIDKAIPFPILFQLTHGDQIRCAVSYKRPSEADPAKWVIEASFTAPWQPSTTEPAPLPVALDLAALYERIIRAQIPIPARSDESLREQVARFLSIETRQREARQLELRLDKEKQFNRKVDLNAQLRTLNAELVMLQRS